MGTKTAILEKPATEEVSTQDICNFILYYCKENGISVSQVKLQKLVFYCHAWYLVHFNKPLIKSGFEAWVNGPVNQEMWEKYKDFDSDEIPLDDIADNSDKMSDDLNGLLISVLKEYSDLTGKQLSDLSHLEDPWINTRGDLYIYELCHKVIPDEEIREYYGKRVE